MFKPLLSTSQNVVSSVLCHADKIYSSDVVCMTSLHALHCIYDVLSSQR